ncbi:MAG: TRL-like family protein [Deltaproteobacteria bacterium]|nr:TRL-like family protein [Deltaproteobacteria bacterium]
MRKLVLAVAAVALFSTGCAGLSFMNRGVAMGTLYVDETGSPAMGTTDNDVGTKVGEACASSILGAAVMGDSSIQTAANAGGITKVGTVNHHYTNILGLYAKYCVIVTGE